MKNPGLSGSRWPATLILLAALGAGMGCAPSFPRPDEARYRWQGQGPDGETIFRRSLAAHGGAGTAVRERDALPTRVVLTTTGRWYALVTRIQPQMTDETFRARGEETLDLATGDYWASFSGPAGNKTVRREARGIAVQYNGRTTLDQDALAATALTADAAYLFYLGPLALAQRNYRFVRLADAREKGSTYYRIYSELRPGLGLSERDEVVFWIHPQSSLVYRTEVTLEGFRRTRGAHVDVTVLDYGRWGPYTLPRELHERVRAPLRLDVHHWQVTQLRAADGQHPATW